MYEGIDPYEDALVEHDEGTPVPYQSQTEMTDNGILTIGMVERERINNINVIITYVDYFEECGLYEFVTDYRNGYLVQVTDINGNDFLKLNITVWSEDMGELAEIYMDFKPFYDEVENKKTASIIRFPNE